MQNRKICTCSTVYQLYLFICKHVSFKARFCLIIAMSQNTLKNVFTIKYSSVDLKMGSKDIKCNNQSIFTNCVSFLSGQ